jgi:hypothetical protein
MQVENNIKADATHHFCLFERVKDGLLIHYRQWLALGPRRKPAFLSE